MNRYKKILENKKENYVVNIAIERTCYGVLRTHLSPGGSIYLNIQHNKTSPKKYTCIIKQILLEVKGKKIQKKIHKLMSSVNGFPSKIKNIQLTEYEEKYPFNQRVMINF